MKAILFKDKCETGQGYVLSEVTVEDDTLMVEIQDEEGNGGIWFSNLDLFFDQLKKAGIHATF